MAGAVVCRGAGVAVAAGRQAFKREKRQESAGNSSSRCGSRQADHAVLNMPLHAASTLWQAAAGRRCGRCYSSRNGIAGNMAPEAPPVQQRRRAYAAVYEVRQQQEQQQRPCCR